tara:strand:- start:9863 stop:10723 length:861 start_codon:yes stop_codon:yes gene_type:complete
MVSPKISVVIPTLGEETLKQTIFSLNRSSIIPEEILICIPEGYASDDLSSISNNIKILKTKVKGQVQQRIEGFKNISFDYVLQVDSDLVLDKFCLENLFKRIKNSDASAVGPKLFDIKTKKYFSTSIPNDNTKLSLSEKIFFFNMNGKEGFKSGKISKSGEPMGIVEDGFFEGLDWLPGACILHEKKNLILYDYYNFKGKAFAEDLYHSFELKKRGISLLRDDNAKCYVDFSSSKSKNFNSYFMIIFNSFKPKKIFRNKVQASHTRFYMFLLLNFLKSFFNLFHRK